MPLAPSDTETISKMIVLLQKVPIAGRPKFARNHLATSHPELIAAFDRIPPPRRGRAVLYASLTPHSRECRLAAAARCGGWDTFYVSRGQSKTDPANYFNFHADMQDMIKLILACWLFPGALVHVFALDGREAVLLAWLKPHRLVIDLYDTISGNASASPLTHQLERELIARADGITHRDLRIKRLQKVHGYVLPKHNIFIHDPLPVVAPRTYQREPSNEIHIVSIGWVGAGDNSIIRVARALCSRGVHLHVYFSPFQQGIRSDTQCYWNFQKENRFFHIESPVYGDDYWAALGRYDFGLAIIEPAVFGEKPTSVTPDAVGGCGSSRLSDYIAADLGVIVSPELNFLHFWSRRFAAATVPANLAFVEDPVAVLRHALEIKAQRKPIDRTSITTQGSAKRLGEFYQRVAS